MILSFNFNMSVVDVSTLLKLDIIYEWKLHQFIKNVNLTEKVLNSLSLQIKRTNE